MRTHKPAFLIFDIFVIAIYICLAIDRFPVNPTNHGCSMTKKSMNLFTLEALQKLPFLEIRLNHHRKLFLVLSYLPLSANFNNFKS